jgi:hypothetical protein
MYPGASNSCVWIVIVIGKKVLFEPQTYLNDSSRREYRLSGFLLLGFRSNIFLTQQGRQLCVQLSNLEGQVPVFMSSSDRMSQLYLQAAGSLFAAYTTLRAKAEVF